MAPPSLLIHSQCACRDMPVTWLAMFDTVDLGNGGVTPPSKGDSYCSWANIFRDQSAGFLAPNDGFSKGISPKCLEFRFRNHSNMPSC